MKSALLALELSSGTSSVAVVLPDKDGQLNFHQRSFGGERGRALIHEIDQLLNECELSRAILGGILVGIGPGSYTGLRIACAAAHTLGLALGIPYAGLGSFEVAALSAPEGTNKIQILQDAYRQEAYYAILERTGNDVQLVHGPEVIAISQIPVEATTNDHWLVFDPRMRKHLDRQEDMSFSPTAENLLRLALARGVQLDGKGLEGFPTAEPLYLRAAAFRSK
jgi:tRNA threonylcarbamoyladenosine biosynthesis protein TsaB